MARKRTEPETPDFEAKLRTVEVGPQKGDSKKDKPTLTVPHLATYAPLNAFYREIESWQSGRGGDPIRVVMTDDYVAEGIRLGRAPVNPDGIDGNNVAHASLVFAKKTSNSGVESHVAARFDARQIRLGKVTHAEKTIRMDPAVYAQHGAKFFNALMAACCESPGVMKVLADFGLKDIYDIYQMQQENSYRCIGDDTISDIFFRAKQAREAAQKDGQPIPPEWTDEAVRELLLLAANPVITVRQFYGNLPDALVQLRKQLCPTAEDIEEAKREAEAAAKAKAKPKTKPTNGKQKRPRAPVADPSPVKMPVGVFAGQTGRNATRIARTSSRRR